MDHRVQRLTGPGRGHHPFGMRFLRWVRFVYHEPAGAQLFDLVGQEACDWDGKNRRPGPSAPTFRPRLLDRVAVARWALVVDLAAGLTGTLLLLAAHDDAGQGHIRRAAQGRLRQVRRRW
jgi:hypothetical protein